MAEGRETCKAPHPIFGQVEELGTGLGGEIQGQASRVRLSYPWKQETMTIMCREDEDETEW